MQKIGIIGGVLGLGSLLARLLPSVSYGSIGTVQRPNYKRQYGSKRTYRAGYILGAKPTDGRWWHDPKDFDQSNTMEAAEVKRQRRSRKLFTQASYSADLNRAHYDEFDNLRSHLNPFYVAK